MAVFIDSLDGNVSMYGGEARVPNGRRSGGALATNRAITIKDVAAAAGVGVATVSRVLSGTGSVSPRTRDRVLRAARELDYRPSALGRSLKLRRTGSIGLLIPDITDPYCAGLVAGVLDCARSLGEHVILDVSHDDGAREAEIVDRLVEQRVDGIIAMPIHADAPNWAAARRVGLAIVFVGQAAHEPQVSGPDSATVPAVLADDRAGVRSVVEYLVGLGHRRIGFVGGPTTSPAGRLRAEAFEETLRDLGVTPDRDLVVRARPSRDSAYAAAASLFQRRADMTALLAGSHLLGEAAVLVAREFDLRVPADVSIAMVDDVAWAELCDPPLTAVARPAEDMGYRACEMLLRDPNRPVDRGRRDGVRPVVLSTELIVRGSCGPPARTR
jgi:LacI family transcriptional regulator